MKRNPVKAMMKETGAALSGRIRQAKTKEALESLGRRCTRHYEAGTIDARQLMCLDGMIMHRLARIEEKEKEA